MSKIEVYVPNGTRLVIDEKSDPRNVRIFDEVLKKMEKEKPAPEKVL